MNLIISEMTNNILKVEPEISRIDASVAGKFKELLFDRIDNGKAKMILQLIDASRL